MLLESGRLFGFQYAIVLHDRSWHLCGYLGVYPAHPWYGKHYDAIEAQVHGGLTYSSDGHDCYPMAVPVDIWWVGFDCAHYNDYAPGLLAAIGGLSGDHERFIEAEARKPWRDRDYVFGEIADLAEQAIAE